MTVYLSKATECQSSNCQSLPQLLSMRRVEVEVARAVLEAASPAHETGTAAGVVREERRRVVYRAVRDDPAAPERALPPHDALRTWL